MFHCCVDVAFLNGSCELSIQNQDLPITRLWLDSHCEREKDLVLTSNYHCSWYFPQRRRWILFSSLSWLRMLKNQKTETFCSWSRQFSSSINSECLKHKLTPCFLSLGFHWYLSKSVCHAVFLDSQNQTGLPTLSHHV